MAKSLFSINQWNFRECQDRFRGDRDAEYYDGDFWIDDDLEDLDTSLIDVSSQRMTVGPFSIINQKSTTNLHFRRNQKHIRDDPTDLSILWFVRCGKLKFSNQHGTKVARPGDFLITRSTCPFVIECQVDHDSSSEVLHVTVPTYVLRSSLGQELSPVLLLPARHRELAIAERIVEGVFASSGNISDQSARTLIDTAISLIGITIHLTAPATPARQTISERRLEEVLRFIEVHLSDPRLSASMVARGCGISPRYLSFVLKLKGTSFSQLVWDKRLKKAKELLALSELAKMTITEIAYSVGFKSAAHFSRMFKRVFNVNPRDFRDNFRDHESEGAESQYSRLGRSDHGGLVH